MSDKPKKTSDEVVVKKVKAYPIKGQLKSMAGAAIPMHIVKLTPTGFLAELAPTAMQPGERFDCAFEIPVLNYSISSPVTLIKLYHHWSGGAGGAASPATAPAQPQPAAQPSSSQGLGGVVHLVEMHFLHVGETEKKQIHSFLSTITKL